MIEEKPLLSEWGSFYWVVPCVFLVWISVLMIDQKEWKKKALIFALIAYAAIYIYLMFIYRLPRSRTQLVLTPFRSYNEAVKYQGSLSTNQFFRSILFNILLYVPLGMIVCSLCNGKILIPFLIGLGITIATEVIQYLTHLGWAEFDDVVNNCIGMVIGIILYSLSKGILNKTIPK